MRRLPVLIAATLCYAWGITLLVAVGAMVIPGLSTHGLVIAATLFPAVVFILAATYCLSGYLIGRQRRSGAWLGATLAAGTTALQFVMHLYLMHINMTPPWLVVNGVILLLVLMNWGQFREVGGEVIA